MNWSTILQSILIALLSGITVSLVNHFLNKQQKREQEKRETRLKVYTSMLYGARAFLDDPSLSKEERRKIKSNFLQKYYNEVILFAGKEVQQKIENFIKTGGVSATVPDNQVNKLKEVIISIRKDLGSESLTLDDFKMYSLDIGGERD